MTQQVTENIWVLIERDAPGSFVCGGCIRSKERMPLVPLTQRRHPFIDQLLLVTAKRPLGACVCPTAAVNARAVHTEVANPTLNTKAADKDTS